MGAIDTSYTFTATDVITSTKMNNILDQSTITATAIIGTTLAVSAGKLSVAAGGVTSNEIGSNAITTTAILDANVTPAKLSNSDFGAFTVASGVATLDADVVTTAKILDANVTPAKLSEPLTLATAQNSTSGTSIDFTSIPSWVKRISVLFSSVSTSGTSNLLIQIGDSGGIENTGYTSAAADVGAISSATNGFILDRIHSASALFRGSIVLNIITGTTFVSAGVLSYSDSTYGPLVASSAGTKALSATLDRLRITTVGGTDTFDAGVINIIYE